MIEITLELSDLVVMQSKHIMSHIFHLKKFATGRPVAKTLIKYNSNNLEENGEEEKEPINIELNERKQILIVRKILLTLDDRMYKKQGRYCFG